MCVNSPHKENNIRWVIYIFTENVEETPCLFTFRHEQCSVSYWFILANNSFLDMIYKDNSGLWVSLKWGHDKNKIQLKLKILKIQRGATSYSEIILKCILVCAF